MNINILDTTLRDGCQGEGIDFSVEDELKIIELLRNFGMSYIEIESPFTNQKSKRLTELLTDWSNITVFTRTAKSDSAREITELVKLPSPTFTVVGKSYGMLAERIMGVSKAENLSMIKTTVECFSKAGKEVIFDAEHFFEAYRNESDYAMLSLSAAVQGGAKIITLCDTSGTAFPWEVATICKDISTVFPNICLGVHFHEDQGLSIANTLAAVRGGATHIQGTFLGFGERIGNTPLVSLLPTLELKLGYDVIGKDKLKKLTPLASEIAEIANITPNKRLPYVGTFAFTHKAGMHWDGILKTAEAFEHITPDSVGNNRRLLISELSGRASILTALSELGITVKKDNPLLAELLKVIKKQEAIGYSYEGAKASFVVLADKILGNYKPHFELISYRVINEMPYIDKTPSTAIVKLSVNGVSKLASSQGDGPVHALDLAMRNALSDFYPTIKTINLTDYKVRVINPEDTTAAKVRVLINSTDGKKSWSTVGVSTDILEASWLALCDSVSYILREI